jgi:hypothetical protein
MKTQLKKRKLLTIKPLPRIVAALQKTSQKKKAFRVLTKEIKRRKKASLFKKSFSYPSSLQQIKTLHSLCDNKFVWYFTYKNLSLWRDKNGEGDDFFSITYLKTSASKFNRMRVSKIRFRNSSKKYIKAYIKAYIETFHKNDWKRTAMGFLKETHAGKLSPIFFQPWKKMLIRPTQRQRWLTTTYGGYQKLRFKDRIDFFRTYLGQMLGNAYWKKPGDVLKINKLTKSFVTQTYFKYSLSHKLSWWYENLVQKRQTPLSAKRFLLDRPKTAFQAHWTQQKLEPWKDALLFKRALYAGFGEDYRKENKFQLLKLKNYLRRKNPRQEKRNRLYTRVNVLLNNFRQRSRIRADKVARIQQVTSKILRPFYGHLRSRQIKNIVKKSKKITSKILGCNEIILNHFENRLDVVVYRINLAPSILWARRLVKAGLVFVTPQNSSFLWDSMYHGLKKLAFPLQLRDPKSLYAKTYWPYAQQNWVEFKFLGQPKRKVSYLLQPGDLVQCAAGTYLNHFKTKSWLCRKPIPKHLLTQQKKNYVWHWPTQQLKHQSFKNWEQNYSSLYAAVFLHAPQYRDLNSKDRVKESFLRWAML